jgi:uncharacterized membrane protein
MSGLFVFLASFLASAVEMVEALTIVLAAGVTRGWRSTLIGVAAGLALLAAIIAILGPALTAVPIDALRLVLTALLVHGGSTAWWLLPLAVATSLGISLWTATRAG